MGRYPKPNSLRAVEDGVGKGGRSRGHRPLKSEPKYSPLSDEPPGWLPKEGRAEWRRLMREFSRYPGLVQRPDREAMIALCSEWAEYVRAIKDRDTAKGRALDSARRQARDTLKNLQVMWARFGLTPGDRARFDLKDREGDDAPILALLTASSDESN